MWPDNETDVDLLGFDFLVVALTEPRLLPLTVGVLGDWGSGKSSLMGLACADLRAEAETGARYLCVRFSPWQYEDYDDVKAALMAAVLAELGRAATGNQEQEAEVGRLKAFMRRFGRRSRRVVRGGGGLLPTAVPAVVHMIDPTPDPTVSRGKVGWSTRAGRCFSSSPNARASRSSTAGGASGRIAPPVTADRQAEL